MTWSLLRAAGIVVATAASFALLVPQPRPDDYEGASRFGDEHAALSARLDSLVDRSFDLRHAIISVAALDRAAAIYRRPGAQPLVQADPGVSPELLAHVRAHVESELAQLAPSPRHPVVVRLLQDSTLSRASASRAIVLPRHEEPCVVLLVLDGSRADTSSRLTARDRRLGTCGFYAAHGMPGRGLSEWLASTRGAAAAGVVTLATVMEGGRRGGAPLPGSGLLACLVGRDDACQQLFSSTEPLNYLGRRTRSTTVPLPPQVLLQTPWQAYFGRGTLLGLLRERLGPDRFEALWKSEDALEVAFARLEGRALGAAIREVLQPLFEPYRPGPAPTGASTLLTMFAVVVAVTVVARAPRRLS